VPFCYQPVTFLFSLKNILILNLFLTLGLRGQTPDDTNQIPAFGAFVPVPTMGRQPSLFLAQQYK
jgi:hypothetical protein